MMELQERLEEVRPLEERKAAVESEIRSQRARLKFIRSHLDRVSRNFAKDFNTPGHGEIVASHSGLEAAVEMWDELEIDQHFSNRNADHMPRRSR